MKHINDDTLIRYLHGDLPPADCEAVKAALGADAALAARLDALRKVRDWGSRAGADAFGPFFASRVAGLAYRGQQRPDPFFLALKRGFVSLAGAAALAALVLGGMNVRDFAPGSSHSTVEAAIGLPADTLETAFIYQPDSAQ